MKNVVDFLKTIKEKGPEFFCHTPTPDGMLDYLSGYSKGCLISSKWFTPDEFISARMRAIEHLGWQVTSANPIREMRDKKLTDESIIEELLNIEIETWQRLPDKG